MGQLKKLESISRGIKRAEEEAIKKGINPDSYDLVNKKRFDYINAQGALLDKGVPNPDKIKVKHTKTVPLKERTIRLTREERLAKWDPSKQYNHNNPSYSKELLLKMSNISSKRPGTVGKYISDVNKFFHNQNLVDGLNNYKRSFFDKKLKEANDSLSPKDKRILRKTIINEAKKTHIKPGNIKSSLKNDKDLLKVSDKFKKGHQGPGAIAIPKNYDLKTYEEFKNGNNTNANKKFIKKLQYGSGPKYNIITAHEIGHLKNLKKGTTIGNGSTMGKEHFANNLGRSMKGNLGETYNKFAKYQEDLYNKSINYNKFNKLGKKLLG